MTDLRPTDHEAALQRYVRSPFNPARKQGFKSAVPPEAMHARREFKRGGFVMLWFAVAALWTCLGIYLVNNRDWVSAVVGLYK